MRACRSATRSGRRSKTISNISAPSFDLNEVPRATDSGRRLRVERRNDNWELILSAFPRAGSDNHQKTDKDFQGSLKIDDLMTPLVGSLPFDDILLVSQEGTIVYQSKKTGPQFMTLSALLQSQITETAPAKSAAEKQAGGAGPAKTEPKTKPETRGGPIDENADPSWRARSMHMTEVMLAGTKYKLFLQPVLVSTFIDAATEEEPASEWVLAGMKSSASVDWEALSLSYTFFIWFTFLFFVIWASYKVLKIIFMNQREHLHLRELGSLGLSLVLLAAVLTFSLLQLDFHLNDDTEAQLHRVGGTLSKNIHDELRQMADQLTEWCGVAANGKDNLGDDLGKVARNGKPGSKDPQEVIRNMNAEGKPLARADIESTPEPTKYPYVNNAFWTDDDGHQIVKWSTIQYVTPMIDVSQLPIYGQAASYLEGNQVGISLRFHYAAEQTRVSGNLGHEYVGVHERAPEGHDSRRYRGGVGISDRAAALADRSDSALWVQFRAGGSDRRGGVSFR